MELEVKIGREVEGPHVLNVPSTYKKVSRRHASIQWKNGIVTIEDNESSNGTFVNGKRIAKAKIVESDVVWLGPKGEDGSYQLDLQKLFESCRSIQDKQRTDYSEEFIDIKQAYQDYKQAESELKKNVTVKSQMPLRIISFIPTLIGAIIVVLPGVPSDARIIAISIGGAITGLVNMMMLGKGNVANDKLTEDITELQIKYQPRYSCPKCGMKYPFTTHWKKIEAEGKCLNPKCNAKFIK
jgi:hypothetical protein